MLLPKLKLPPLGADGALDARLNIGAVKVDFPSPPGVPFCTNKTGEIHVKLESVPVLPVICAVVVDT